MGQPKHVLIRHRVKFWGVFFTYFVRNDHAAGTKIILKGLPKHCRQITSVEIFALIFFNLMPVLRFVRVVSASPKSVYSQPAPSSQSEESWDSIHLHG